jgi:superoxide dismutase, Cu-Zn family
MHANWIGAVVGAGVLLSVPAVAVAGRTTVDHGHGATVAHDSAYAGVRTQVHAWSKDGETRFRLMATGLPPNRSFGAHVHTGRCGLDPAASGGHYQHPGTTGPLSEREVWLDISSDADGRAVSETTRPWTIDAGDAGSVVIHAATTNPSTGAAGARLLCTDVAFGE